MIRIEKYQEPQGPILTNLKPLLFNQIRSEINEVINQLWKLVDHSILNQIRNIKMLWKAQLAKNSIITKVPCQIFNCLIKIGQDQVTKNSYATIIKLAASNCLFQKLVKSYWLDQNVNKKQIWKLKLLNFIKKHKSPKLFWLIDLLIWPRSDDEQITMML